MKTPVSFQWKSRDALCLAWEIKDTAWDKQLERLKQVAKKQCQFKRTELVLKEFEKPIIADQLSGSLNLAKSVQAKKLNPTIPYPFGQESSSLSPQSLEPRHAPHSWDHLVHKRSSIIDKALLRLLLSILCHWANKDFPHFRPTRPNSTLVGVVPERTDICDQHSSSFHRGYTGKLPIQYYEPTTDVPHLKSNKTKDAEAIIRNKYRTVLQTSSERVGNSILGNPRCDRWVNHDSPTDPGPLGTNSSMQTMPTRDNSSAVRTIETSFQRLTS